MIKDFRVGNLPIDAENDETNYILNVIDHDGGKDVPITRKEVNALLLCSTTAEFKRTLEQILNIDFLFGYVGLYGEHEKGKYCRVYFPGMYETSWEFYDEPDPILSDF